MANGNGGTPGGTSVAAGWIGDGVALLAPTPRSRLSYLRQRSNSGKTLATDSAGSDGSPAGAKPMTYLILASL